MTVIAGVPALSGRETLAWRAGTDGGQCAFISSSDYVTIPAGGSETAFFALVNPTGSGKKLCMWDGEFGSDTNTSFRRLAGTAVTLVGTPTARPVRNYGGGALASVAKPYILGEFTYTGGTLTKGAYMTAYEMYWSDFYGVTLAPGAAALWTVEGRSSKVIINLRWWEIPV